MQGSFGILASGKHLGQVGGLLVQQPRSNEADLGLFCRFSVYGCSNLRFVMAASVATLAYRIAAPRNCATSS